MLTNHDDIQYTAEVRIGGQKMTTVVDTGSFELLAFSNQCSSCGGTTGLYDENKSKTFEDNGFIGEHSFGSGNTRAKEAFDIVSIGHFVSKRQHFWEVIDADMRILDNGYFHAILGMGPPRSAQEFARLNSEDVHKELDYYQKAHGDVPKSILKEAKYYEDVLEHAKVARSFMEILMLSSVSFCLGTTPGSQGYLALRDSKASALPESTKFTTLDVVGDIYWSAALSNVRLGGASERLLGCSQGYRCSAVVDTGTSMIVAPSTVIGQIEDLLAEMGSPADDCSDLSGLPNLEFEMNGHLFSLPPQSYVGKMIGDPSDEEGDTWPQKKRHKKQKSARCVPLVMASDTDTQFGQLWILGMPFFRKYHTTFHLTKSGSEAAKMSFATADADCYPQDSKGAVLREHPRTSKVRPFTFDISKIKRPHWLPKSSRRESMPQSLVAQPQDTRYRFRRMRRDTLETATSVKPFVHI